MYKRQVLDASAIKDGDGGEIVVWSDISNPASVTTVGGTLLAKGGREGGDGGDIETSGFALDVAGIDVDATASQGEQGLWLLDPFDYTLASSEATAIVTALEAGNDVTISTAAGTSTAGSGSVAASGSESATAGTITVSSEINVDSGAGGSLSLIADKDIVINASIISDGSASSKDLTLNSKTGVAINSGVSIDWNPGSSSNVLVTASDSGGLSGAGGVVVAQGTVLDVTQAGDTTFSGVISGAGALSKAGSGTMTLSGANTYTGTTTISSGKLTVTGSLADTTAVTVASGATYDVDSSDTIGSLAGAGTIELASGVTLTTTGLSVSNTTSEDFASSSDGTGSLVTSSSQISGQQGVNNTFTGRVKSLFFGNAATSDRQATTDSFDPTNGATINFDLIYGNDTNGGEQVDSGEEVVLEYSINGGAFASGLEIAISSSSDLKI